MHLHRIHEINGDTPGSPQNLRTRTGPVYNGLPFLGQCFGMPVAQPVHVIEEHESRQGPCMLAQKAGEAVGVGLDPFGQTVF